MRPDNPDIKVIECASESDIRAGDYVIWEESWDYRGVEGNRILRGIAHHQDETGEWRTKDGAWITDLENEECNTTITIFRTTPTDERPNTGTDIRDDYKKE